MLSTLNVEKSEKFNKLAKKLVTLPELQFLLRYDIEIDVILTDLSNMVKIREASNYEKLLAMVDVIIELDRDTVESVEEKMTESIIFNELQRVDVKINATGARIIILPNTFSPTKQTLNRYGELDYYKTMYGDINGKKGQCLFKYGDIYGKIRNTPRGGRSDKAR